MAAINLRGFGRQADRTLAVWPSGRLAILSVVMFSCGGDAPPAREFDGQAAFGYAEQQMAFGPRIAGTEGHERMGDWLDSLLRQKADTLIVQEWRHVTAQGDTLRMRNFIARFNSAATERILYLAHWDTRPRADRDSTSDSTQAVPGANDGASGVAILLGVADRLRAQPSAVGVDLLFTDGEDYGDFSRYGTGINEKADVLIGSTYYALHPPPGAAPRFAVLFDMVGDKDLNIFAEGYSSSGAPEVVDRVWTVAEELGYSTYFSRQGRHQLLDDHVPLQRAGISAIDVVDFDYAYWHTAADTIDKIGPESLKIVGDVAVAVIRRGVPPR
jgi:glutaminyl-peptide cyclotransferase